MVEAAPAQQWNVIFNSGGGGHHESLRTPNATLKKSFGPKTTVINSIILGDTPSPTRFADMAATYRDAITNGPTVIMAHSLGAPEAVKALTLLREEGFFTDENNRNNTKLVFVSPTGMFRTPIGGLGYLGRFGRVAVQEAGMVEGKTVPFGKTSLLQGIQSLTILPPEGLDREKLIQHVRDVSPKLSHYDASLAQVNASPDRDYFQFVDEDKKPQITAIDTELIELFDHTETLTDSQKKRAKTLIRRRGKLTDKVVKEAFANTHADTFEDPPIPIEVYDKNKASSRLVRRFLSDTFLKAKAYKEIEALQATGIEIYDVDPENDIMRSHRRFVRQAERLLGNEYRDHVMQLPFALHNGPYSPQPTILVELAKEVIRRSEEKAAA